MNSRATVQIYLHSKCALAALLTASLFITSRARAGVLETLSHGAFIVSKGSCAAATSSEIEAALSAAECNCQSEKTETSLRTQIASLIQVKNKALGTPEDRFFALLGRQHSRELDCASQFAQSMTSAKPEDLDAVATKFKLLRDAKQRVVAASQAIASDPAITPKICPLTLGDLKPAVLSAGVPDRGFEACRTIIISRLAVQTIQNSIPLAGVPAIKSLLELYANVHDGTDLETLEIGLNQRIKQAYADGRMELLAEGRRLDEILSSKGGAGFDRSARRALLSDPRVVAKITRSGGDQSGLESLACEADARFGKGAENLETGLLVGSLALSGGVGLLARASSVGLKLAEGAAAARATGFISLNAARTLIVSATMVSSLSTYSSIEKACFDSQPGLLAGATHAENACEGAPDISQFKQDGCILAASLSAIGYASIAGGAATRFLAKLTPYSSSRVEAMRLSLAQGKVPDDFIDRSTDVFVIRRTYAGQHGGNRIAVERQGAWGDPRKDFNKNGGDVTVDLRFWPTTLGKKQAEFFGFRVVNGKYMILPDEKELAGAIEKFNRGLPIDSPQRIAINFYGTKGSFITPRRFVERFANSGELPISRKGRQFYHDVSAHSMEGFVFNNELVEVMRLRSKLWLDFVEEQKRASSILGVDLAKADTAVTKRLTSEIDQSGNMIGAFLTGTDENFLVNVGQKVTLEAQKKVPLGWTKEHLSTTPNLIQGYSPTKRLVQLVSAPPTDYFLPILEAQNTEIATRFRTFVTARASRDPVVNKQVSFDWQKDVEWLNANRMKIKRGDRSVADDFANLELTKPFFMRMNRLQTFVERPP